MSEDRRIKIFDTTLRDGQQCPGAGMSFAQNLEYARLAAELRFDVIEAGFPSASQVDFEIVHEIAKLYGDADDDAPTVAGLCQLRSEQVDSTIKALEPAIAKKRARLHTYVPVDPELMRASLGAKADKAQIAKDVFEFVKRAVDAGLEVEFSPEGYSRMGTNFDFTTDLIRAAVDAGAAVINCPDTIGGACSFQGDAYFVSMLNKHAAIIAEEFPQSSITWSAHCHNDFGLAVQNSLNAVFEGPARQIEGCINGVGERAGNAALESVIMIIRQFGSAQDSDNPWHTNVRVERLQEICDFISANMLERQPHWPVSGKNAAKHSSGGHTNAILKNPLAYQPFDPREIGKNISFLFGPLSGGNHAKSIIEDAGYVCADDEKAAVAQFIKDEYKERRKGITDRELLEGYFLFRSPIRVSNFNYARSSGKSEIQLAGTFFEQSGDIVEVHEGNNSALAALKQLADRYFPLTIQSHRSESSGAGYDATSISRIVVADEEENVYEGVGEDQDIEISAMKAFIDAVNRTFIEKNYKII